RYRHAWRVPPFAPIAGQLADLTPAVTRRLADPDETQWIQKGPGTDLSALPTGVVRLGPYRFHVSGAVMLKGARAAAADLPQSVTLELGGAKARALAFLHTTGWIGSQRYERVGSYTLTYADGSKATLALEYGRHLTSWLEPQVRTVVYEPVWRGKTADGLDAGLNALVWNNPKPELPIQSLTLESGGAAANPTLVGLTLLERSPYGAEAPR
ncbi:hypothetical protein, partial [Calidithermus terrae]|uniref:hypothetical protein n=1 Tax=Calidithermus terrae TaxID=1408545 RepID=UPI001C3F4E4E